MAKILKTCKNPECSFYNKKDDYNKDDRYCKKCGQELYHVCKSKKCTTVLNDDKQKYCLRCQALIEQRKANAKQNVKNAGTVIGGTVAAVVTTAKVVVDVSKNIVKK